MNPYIYPGIVIVEKNYTPDEKMKVYENILIKEYGAPDDFLTNRTRKQEYVHARYVYFYMVIEVGKVFCHEQIFGYSALERKTGYDHSTVYFGVQVVKGYIDAKSQNLGKVINRQFEQYEKLILKTEI